MPMVVEESILTMPVKPVAVTSMFDEARMPGEHGFALPLTDRAPSALLLFLVIASEELARFLRVIPSLNFSSRDMALSRRFMTPPRTSASMTLSAVVNGLEECFSRVLIDLYPCEFSMSGLVWRSLRP